MQAKIATVYSMKDIEEKCKNNPYLILFAYKKDAYTNKKNSIFKQKINSLDTIIGTLADHKEYLYSGVRFATARADKDFWEALIAKYDSDTDEDMCFIIFEDGHIMEQDGQKAYLFGKQGSEGLKEFIKKYVGDEIANTMKKMKQEQRRRAEQEDEDNDDNQSNTSINVYYPSYYDPYYYYWGYPWYTYGPRWRHGYYGRHGGGWRGGGHFGHGGGHRGHR